MRNLLWAAARSSFGSPTYLSKRWLSFDHFSHVPVPASPLSISIRLCQHENHQLPHFRISWQWNFLYKQLVRDSNGIQSMQLLRWHASRPRLNHSYNEHEWTVLPAPFGTPLQEVCNLDTVDYPCPHELWLALDLTRDWSTYSTFTLRLSWAASVSLYILRDILGVAHIVMYLHASIQLTSL